MSCAHSRYHLGRFIAEDVRRAGLIGAAQWVEHYEMAGYGIARSFSVSEKLARYGSSALSGVEHLTLLVGKESIALALIRHFGSLKALARASFQELRQFLPQRKAEAVAAALSMFAIAETGHVRSEQLDNPESI
jgi:DNA repair protein RadC